MTEKSEHKPSREATPKSTPRDQHGHSKPIGPGPSGQQQTDDQDNLNNNVSNLGEGR